MKLKFCALLYAFVATPLHASTPEAVINAALLPEADYVIRINPAQINDSEFGRHALSVYDKVKALLARKENKTIVCWEKSMDINCFKARNISLADIQTVFISGLQENYKKDWEKFSLKNQEKDWEKFLADRGSTGETLALQKAFRYPEIPTVCAIVFNKPFTIEAFREFEVSRIENAVDDVNKLIPSWFSESIEPVESGILYNQFGRTHFSSLFDGNITYYGSVSNVNATIRRAKAGMRADESPVVKALLNKTPTRRDAYCVVSSKAFIREYFKNFDLGFFLIDKFGFDTDSIEEAPMGKEIRSATDGLIGLSLGVDCTDKMSVTMVFLFDKPEDAVFAGGFLFKDTSDWIKNRLQSFTNTAMPFTESLKVVSIHDKTVTVSCEVTVKDLEILLRIVEQRCL